MKSKSNLFIHFNNIIILNGRFLSQRLKQFDMKFEFLNEKIKLLDRKFDKISSNRNYNQQFNTTDTFNPVNMMKFDRSLSIQSTSLQSQIASKLNNPPILLEEETEDESNNYVSKPPLKLSDIKTVEKKKTLKSQPYNLQPYTSRSVLLNYRADPDIIPNKFNRPLFKFNQYDEAYEVDRTSCMGEYKIVDSLPICPNGKRNLLGRGNLFYWGPNHAIQAIITKSTSDKSCLLVLDKKINDFNYKLPHVSFINKIIYELFIYLII